LPFALPAQRHARPRAVTAGANQPDLTSSTGCYGFSLFADYDTAVGIDDFAVHRVSAGLRKSF
jgi:hypothetical protein